MLNSANQAWTMYPGLSHGAYECLHAHGTPEQKTVYLPKLVSGDWTGTMCLTEPHCGTDLGILRTKAEPNSRRHLRDHRHQDLHLRRRARSRREHRASRARAPAGRAGRAPRAFRCSSCRSSCPTRRRRLGARNGVACGVDRTQDGHPRQRHLRDQFRRRERLARRRAEQGPERDVRDDERGAARRRHAGARA